VQIANLQNLPALFGEKAWKLRLIIPSRPKMKGDRKGFRIDPAPAVPSIGNPLCGDKDLEPSSCSGNVSLAQGRS